MRQTVKRKNQMKKLLFALLCWIPFMAHAAPADLTQANQLINAGQAGAALEVLRPLQSAENGNPVYHYLLGLALLDTGRLDEAEIELKRSLTLRPDLAQAQAELGRVYVLKGDPINAYLAFQAVRAADVPPEALVGMNRFIDGMARKFNPQKRVFGALSIGVGYDSNVNAGTTASTITLPLFGGVIATLDPKGQPQESAFSIVSGNLTVDTPLNDGMDFVGGLAASAKFNAENRLNTYDMASGEISAGLRHTAGPRQLSVSASFASLNYLDRLYRQQTGLNLGWRQIVDLPLVDLPMDLDVQLHHAYLDYPGDVARNARRSVLSVGLRPSFFGRRIQYAPQLVSAYVGTEQTDDSRTDFLSYRLWGLRAAYLDRVGNGVVWFASGGMEHRRYDAADNLFQLRRDDRQFDLALGLSVDLGQAWSLVPTVQWIDTHSNMVVYDYQRTTVSIAARKTF